MFAAWITVVLYVALMTACMTVALYIVLGVSVTFARDTFRRYYVSMDDYLAAQDYCATVEHERDTLARCLDAALAERDDAQVTVTRHRAATLALLADSFASTR